MIAKLLRSSKRTPCPVCDRTKDGDCRTHEAENLVLCHTYTQNAPEATARGYKYLHPSKDGLWGVWIYQQVGSDGKTKGKKLLRKSPRQEFIYLDRSGNRLLKAVRIPKNGGKEFAQFHWNGSSWVKGLRDTDKRDIPIYRYPQVREAIEQKKTIFVVEGEGKADLLWSLGIPATTTLGGSKKYRSYGNYANDLKDAQLVLCPDRDVLGVEHMADIARDFPGAKWCYVFPNSPIWNHVPDNGGLDVADWVSEGATVEDIFNAVGDRRSATPGGKEEDSPEGRKVKHGRILSELGRIEAIEDTSLQALEKHVLSKKEGIPRRELNEIWLESQKGRAIQTVSVKDLCEAPDEDQAWLIDTLLELGVSLLLVSEAKTGKTPLAYDIAYSVATGQPWLGEYAVPEKGGVLIIQSDESVRAAKKNFRRRGLHRLENVQFTQDFSIEQLPALEQTIARLKKSINLKLVVIDSLSSVNKNSIYSENDSEYARDLYLLTQLAAEMSVTILIIHHRNKAPNTSGLCVVSGTGRIPAAVDDIWTFSRMKDKDDPTHLKRVLERVAGHDGDLFRYVLELQLEDRGWTLEGTYDGEASEGSRIQPGIPLREEMIPVGIRDRVLEFINQSDHRWTPYDLAEATGINPNSARRTLLQLVDSGAIDRERLSTQRGGFSFAYFKKNSLPSKTKESCSVGGNVSTGGSPPPSNPEPSLIKLPENGSLISEMPKISGRRSVDEIEDGQLVQPLAVPLSISPPQTPNFFQNGQRSNNFSESQLINKPDGLEDLWAT